ncbi:hypothetical protein [Streptomyces sp. NPDC048590]|uniref:hypothetical protein n=1 Tax=Streptomyces sp. NPDC048590 TaxID=3365574 RepID=UPI003723B4E5
MTNTKKTLVAAAFAVALSLASAVPASADTHATGGTPVTTQNTHATGGTPVTAQNIHAT